MRQCLLFHKHVAEEDWWAEERAYVCAGCKPREVPDFGHGIAAPNYVETTDEQAFKAAREARLAARAAKRGKAGPMTLAQAQAAGKVKGIL